MSRIRASRLFQGQALDKVPFFLGGLDHPVHTKQVTGIDAYEHPGDAFLEYCRRLDIDIITGVPGGSAHFALGEVRDQDSDWVSAEWGVGATVWHQPVGFDDAADVLRFRPLEEDDLHTVYGHLHHRRSIAELTDEFGESHRKAQEQIGDVALLPAFFGTTLFQYGLALFGWEAFLEAAGSYPKEYGELLEQFAQISIKVATAWADTDIEVFFSHDDLAMTRSTVMHPDWYREYIIPWYKEIWAPLKKRGIKVIMVSDGNYSAITDDIIAAGADGLFSEPLVDIATLVEKYGVDKVLLGGGDTPLITTGTKEEVVEDVRSKMAIAKKAPHYCFMAGGGTPQNCPLENVSAFFDTFTELRDK